MDKILNQSLYELEEKFSQFSLRLFLQKKIKIKLLFIYVIFVFLITLSANNTFYGLFVFINLMYFMVQAFKLFIFLIAIFYKDNEEKYPLPKDLPLYSILLPLYKEENVISQLIDSISSMDYPQDLLEVKLLVEEDDEKIIKKLAIIDLPKNFSIIKVPFSDVRTKPKACNYGLYFVKGKYVVVYDAEDRPNPNQLKLSVAKFALMPNNVICLQARLNYYNYQQNYLTKLFSIEYGILFGYLLKGLNRLGMIIPLGGTSNHFVTDKLREVGAWDAFNVTEDADLGIRLNHFGYKTELLASETLEESPTTLKAWIVQRSRWIKGNLLTCFLHLNLSSYLGLKKKFGLFLFLYLPNLIYILLPLYLVLSMFFIKFFSNDWLWKINLYIFILMPIFYSSYYIIDKKIISMKSIILFSFFYFGLFPIAGIRALWQSIKKPFYWDKTEHGAK